MKTKNCELCNIETSHAFLCVENAVSNQKSESFTSIEVLGKERKNNWSFFSTMII